MSMFVKFFFPPSDPQVHTETHQPDQTKINVNGFDMAKCAAQLLYGPVLVFQYLQVVYVQSYYSM